MRFVTVTDRNGLKAVVNLETINSIALTPEKDGSYCIRLNNLMFYVSKDEANRILGCLKPYLL